MNDVETKRLMFDITDGRSSVNVTLFNEVGEAHEQHLLQKMNDNLVIIIAAAKIHKYEGKVNLINFPATRIYVNPNHYSVEEVKGSYNRRPALTMTEEVDEVESIKTVSVVDIQSLGLSFIERKVKVQIIVKRMDGKSAWYFARCTKCNLEEVLKEGGRYKCAQCKRIIPHPDKRFRVFAYGADKTGCVGIVFKDAQVRRVIQKSVFDIHAEYVEEPVEEPFPEELKQLLHKEYTVTLQLTEDNLKNGGTVYDAVDLDNASERSANFSPSKLQTEQAENMSVMTDNRSTTHVNQTPDTGKSTNQKRRPRKHETTVPFHEDENVPAKLKKN